MFIAFLQPKRFQVTQPAGGFRTDVLFLSLATLLLAGCSGGGDESPSTGGASSKPAAEEPAATADSDSQSDDKAPSEAAAPESDSDDSGEKEPAKKQAAKTPAAPVDPSATGSFFGKIVLDGDAPKLAPLASSDDESLKDKEVCGKADVPNEALVVGDSNGIANVFVYLRRAPKGFEAETPEETVVLDQKGCVFKPHVALIQTGQKVLVTSSDPVQHNVHTFPARNQGANILIKPNDKAGVALDYSRAESEPLQVKCDIHAWMSSYHLVLDHPFMAVTDANGDFRIDGLPAGTYEFRVWHEKGGLLERDFKVSVTGNDEATELKYAVSKFSL